MSKTLTCGHDSTPDNFTFTTGYATLPNGETLCYPCADEYQRDELKNSNTFVGYVNSDQTEITTWTGGKLMDMTPKYGYRQQTGTRQITPSGGYWRRHDYRAKDVHGQEWYGFNSGPSMAIRMRKVTK